MPLAREEDDCRPIDASRPLPSVVVGAVADVEPVVVEFEPVDVLGAPDRPVVAPGDVPGDAEAVALPESVGPSAWAVPAPPATAAPTPSANANAPMRPT
ncbi:hypothetical protein [Mycolicibacterium sediminis]|nr:hypothetical protein [Mycolicibacterium sediminis]